MSIRLGVDLGTTWTAAAISEGRAEVVQLGTHGNALPSVVALDGETWVVGEAAERKLAADPATGAREVKRRLGDTTPIVVANQPFGAEALMAPLLAAAIATATERAGSEPTAVSITHPANWGGYKLDLLREVGRLAGRDDVDLVAEPAAAALHYAQLGRIADGDLVAVYDFGGGTFDVALVRCTDGQAEVVGTPNGLERLGGVDLDQIVLVHVDAALDGKLRDLDTTQADVRAAIGQLRSACTSAKEALSTDTDAAVPVALPDLQTEVRITRAEFETAVRARIQDTLGAFDRAVDSAGVTPGDLAGVLLVGGSTRIPVVAEMVAEHTGRPLLVDADPKAVVALGAAGTGAASAPGAGAAVAGAAAGATRQGREKAAAGSRERGATLLGAAAATAVAGGAAAAGLAGYSRLTGDDGDGGDDGADADASDDSGASADDSMDAFDEVGPAGGGPGASGGGGATLAGGVSSFSASPAGRVSARLFADDPVGVPLSAAGAAAPATAGGLFADPSVDAARDQLRSRLEAWQPPEGADPAEFAAVKADLEGLLDRYHPYPGQSPDDAIASLRYEFEDRVHDFAQDQKLDALLDERAADEAADAALDDEIDSAREDLLERLGAWEAPDGADADAVADLRADLEGILDRFTPIPGQSADDALADLRARFNDRVADFSQDQKLDAVVDELKADPPDPTEPEAEADPTAPEPPAPADPTAADEPAAEGDEAPEEPAPDGPAPDEPFNADDLSIRTVSDPFEEMISDDAPERSIARDPLGAGVGDPPPAGTEETLIRPRNLDLDLGEDDALGTHLVSPAAASSSPMDPLINTAGADAAAAAVQPSAIDDLDRDLDLAMAQTDAPEPDDALDAAIDLSADDADDLTGLDDDVEPELDPALDDPLE
jgi:actin-like ATPase involved in cell morphogenesis